jgi:hypothetical protein
MREFVCFQWLCIKDAWRGCWTRANELAGLLGGGILWLGLLVLAPQLREQHLIEAPSTYWGAAGFAFGSAVASVALAYFVIYLWRLLTAPNRLYWGINERLKFFGRKAKAKIFFVIR